jgi:hypothetical protein
MIQRHSGGQGKSGPDALDKRLAVELGRELPRLLDDGTKQNDIGEMKEQMKFLVGREASRADKERIAELEAKIAAMESGQALLDEVEEHKATLPKCGGIKKDGTPCNSVVKEVGGRCPAHRETEEVTV